MMKKNMGGLDRIIRLLVVIAVALGAFLGVLEGTLMYVLYGLAGVFLLTSLIGVCPLYSLVGLSTCKVEK
jgi:hypothetical protein